MSQTQESQKQARRARHRLVVQDALRARGTKKRGPEPLANPATHPSLALTIHGTAAQLKLVAVPAAPPAPATRLMQPPAAPAWRWSWPKALGWLRRARWSQAGAIVSNNGAARIANHGSPWITQTC